MTAPARLVPMTVALALVMSAQLPPELRSEILRLFPAASSISPRGGEPPHFKVFQRNPETGLEELTGFAFWTTDVEPLERGYGGPIKILVGMNTKGILSGIIVVSDREPYGYFSVEPPAFAAQFAGKSIKDPFQVGNDIDAVSRASISIASATRAVRNSARRVARQLLTEGSSGKK